MGGPTGQRRAMTPSTPHDPCNHEVPGFAWGWGNSNISHPDPRAPHAFMVPGHWGGVGLSWGGPNRKLQGVFLLANFPMLAFFWGGEKEDIRSGQISIIPKPELRGFWGSSLIKPPFRVTSADVVIICPDKMILNGSWAEYSEYELWLGRSDHSFSLVQDSNHHCSSLLHGLDVTCTHVCQCVQDKLISNKTKKEFKKTGRRDDRTWKAWFNPLWTSNDIYIYMYRILKRITSGVLKDCWKFHKVPLNFAASKRMMHFTRSAPWFSCLIAAFLRGAGNCPFPIPSNPYDWGIGLKIKVFNDTLQNPSMSIMRTSKNDTAGHNIPCVYHTNSIYICVSVL